MAKKLTRKEKIALQQKSGVQQPVHQTKASKRRFPAPKQALAILIAVIAFALYANTLNHQYALDDFGLIPENTMTRKGLDGMKEIFTSSYRAGMTFTDNQVYRPLSKALFALEWQIAPDKPALGHWVNVIIFACTCVLLFYMLSLFMKGNMLVPFIATLLFAAHPIHTEVVANIKGGDETLCLLFCLLTTLSSFRFVVDNKKRYLVASCITFFLALLSKETAITWLAVIPLFLYFFTGANQSQYLKTILSLVVSTAIFLLIRQKILGHDESLIPVVDNYLAGIDNPVTRKTSAIFLMGVYLKLLFFPHPLSCDGSFNHFPETGPGDWRFLIPFIVYISLAVFAIMQFRKKNLVAFGILYFLLTASIISNVIVLIGTNYGERLLYIPSLGFCISLAILLVKAFRISLPDTPVTNVRNFFNSGVWPISITALIVILFGLKTVARNAAWYDDDTLFKTDITTVPNSAHMRYYLANHLSSDDILDKIQDSTARAKQSLEAIDELSKCIEIYPKYADAYQRRAYMYYKRNRYDLAEPDFKKSLEYNNTNSITYNNYGNLLFNSRRFPEAMDNFKQALRYNPSYAHAANNLGSAYGVYAQGDMEKANRDPANRDAHLAQATKQFEMAIYYFKKAIEIDKEYVEPYRLIAVTYRTLGKPQEADRYAAMGEELQRTLDKKKKNKNS